MPQEGRIFSLVFLNQSFFQSEAWGTMGFKNQNAVLIIPNTDPTMLDIYETLPNGSCPLDWKESKLIHLQIKNNQFYLSPDVANVTTMAQELYQATLSQLVRIQNP
jgi:hypothetical protein